MIIQPHRVFTACAFELCLPPQARFLSVQTMNGEPWMWFLVDEDLALGKPVTRMFTCFRTGEQFLHGHAWTYLGTFQVALDDFLERTETEIYHLFEL